MIFGSYPSVYLIIFIAFCGNWRITYMNDLSYFSTSYYTHIEDPLRVFD